MHKYLITFQRVDDGSQFETEYHGVDEGHALGGACAALRGLGETKLRLVSQVRADAAVIRTAA